MQAPEVSMVAPERGLDRGSNVEEQQLSPLEPQARSQVRPQARVDLATLAQMIPAPMRATLTRINGAFLCLVSLLGFLSLSTWTISDPSLTFANGGNADNWLGFYGASFSDFSLQFVGFAAIILLVPMLAWGIFKLTGRSLGRLRNRLWFWLGSTVLLAAALGCVAVPEGWPLPVGLGGVVGDAVLSIPHTFTGNYPGGIFATILFVLFAVPGFWMLLCACNMSNGIPGRAKSAEQIEAETIEDFPEDELAAQFDQGGIEWSAIIAAPLGLIMHCGYSLSAAFRKHRQQHALNKQAAMYVPGSIPPAPEMGAELEPHPVAPQPVSAQPAAMPQAAPADGIDPAPEAYSAEPMGENFAAEPEAPMAAAAAPVSGEPEIMERARVAAPGMDMDDDPVPHTDAADNHPIVERPAGRIPPRPSGGEFVLPSLNLLSMPQGLEDDPSLSNEALEENARLLEGVLADFGVKGQILKVRPGPVVTLYELEPAPGVKSSRVIGLAEDIARSMSAIAARVAVVPGRNAIGIELPNKRRETVYLREQFQSKEFKTTKAKLAMCLGKTIGGEAVVADLAKMPHLLVAGTTGSGKSVAINTMILSLLYRLGPDRCKLIMIDPKMLELSIYDGIPHLLTPVVVDPKKAVVALKWTVREMEDRYKKMSKVGVRNIDGFNARITEAKAKGEVITRTVQTGFDRHTGEAIYEHEELDLDILPFIVVIIDEMADLMMVAGKDIEGTVQRLAQMARAAGIHVIMATQRPSVDVITGTIKANFPTRISFQVTSKIDSRTILGEMGAEQLLGMGDMLYMAGGGRITRVHGPFVDDQEVEDIVNHLKAQGVPQYLEAVTEEDEEEEAASGGSDGGGGDGAGSDSEDPYDQAVAIVLRDRKVSTSYIQRRLSIGYNRAASLIERMEQEGLISPANHAGKREILVPAEDEMFVKGSAILAPELTVITKANIGNFIGPI